MVLMPFQAQIHITLKPSIFDPAGAAIEASLHQLGHDQVAQVRLGKIITFVVDALEAETARQQATQMCEQLLANPVIEHYTVDIQPVGSPRQAVQA